MRKKRIWRRLGSAMFLYLVEIFLQRLVRVKKSAVTVNGRAKTEQSVEVVSATELTIRLGGDDTGVDVAQLEVEIYNLPPGVGKQESPFW